MGLENVVNPGCCECGGSATSGRCTLTIHVQTPAGLPLAGAIIRLLNAQGVVVYTGVTDANGNFQVPWPLPAGAVSYTVTYAGQLLTIYGPQPIPAPTQGLCKSSNYQKYCWCKISLKVAGSGGYVYVAAYNVADNYSLLWDNSVGGIATEGTALPFDLEFDLGCGTAVNIPLTLFLEVKSFATTTSDCGLVEATAPTCGYVTLECGDNLTLHLDPVTLNWPADQTAEGAAVPCVIPCGPSGPYSTTVTYSTVGPRYATVIANCDMDWCGLGGTTFVMHPVPQYDAECRYIGGGIYSKSDCIPVGDGLFAQATTRDFLGITGIYQFVLTVYSTSDCEATDANPEVCQEFVSITPFDTVPLGPGPCDPSEIIVSCSGSYGPYDSSGLLLIITD